MQPRGLWKVHTDHLHEIGAFYSETTSNFPMPPGSSIGIVMTQNAFFLRTDSRCDQKKRVVLLGLECPKVHRVLGVHVDLPRCSNYSTWSVNSGSIQYTWH